MARLSWPSGEAWALIDPHPPRGEPGRPPVDDRRVLGGIPHVPQTGCRWRDVPPQARPGRHRPRPLQQVVAPRAVTPHSPDAAAA